MVHGRNIMADPFGSSQVDSLSYSKKNKLYKNYIIINIIKFYLGLIPWIFLFVKRLKLNFFPVIIRVPIILKFSPNRSYF